MGDAKSAGIPLLDFRRTNDVAPKNSGASSSSISIEADDPDVDIEGLRSVLQQHARDGNVEALEAMLNKYPQLVDKPDVDNLTSLHYAAKYGNVRVAELLLDRGASLESFTTADWYTPLHMVAKYGRVGVQQQSSRESTVSKFIDASVRRAQSLPETERTPSTTDPTTALVDLLVRRGADVNATDQYGMTPLDHATLKDNEIAVRALLKNGADPNRKDENDSTSLLKACICGSNSLVRLLLSSGADCNVADKWNNSVYHQAARHGRNDILQLLIDHAGKSATEFLWMLNNEGKTPLELAVTGNHPDTVAIILSVKPADSKSEIFQMDKWLLHKAAAKGFIEVVKILIQHGYDVRLRDTEKKLPLHHAALSKRLDVVRFLLELAPDCIDEQDEYGMSAFLYAVSMNALDTVKLLVENNTDILDTDVDGRTAVFIGAKYNAINVLMYLLEIYRKRKAEEGASYPDVVNQEDYNQTTPMHLVCHNGYMEAVTLLHEYGARLDILNEDEEISLHCAAATGQTAVVRQLVEWDKRLVMHRDEHGNTPLHLAAQNDHEVTTKVLIDAGSDIEAKNSHEETALECAIVRGQLGAVKVLLQKNACIENKEDVSQATMLHAAAFYGHDAIVRLLLDSGATIDRREEDWNTALDLALVAGHRTVAQVLVESQDWRKIVTPGDRLPIGRHNETRNTPLRNLIADFPDVAKIVLDKCVETMGNNSDPFYMVTYDFSLLDDTYMMPSKDGKELIGKISPYDKHGKLKKRARAYSDDYDVVYANHPLNHSTTLHLAAKNGYDAIVRLLLDSGATIDRMNEDFCTALDLAISYGHRAVAQVLVESAEWRKVMTPTDTLPLGRHSETRNTPLRSLISAFPDVAKIVLDKCVEAEGGKSEPLYCVAYDFSLVDDTYMMPSKDETELLAKISPYDDDGKLKKGAKAYSEDYDVVYENHPLKMMADAEKLSLLSHPLVFGLLKYKWNSLGRYVYYLALMIYIAFICFFTLFITYTPAPFNVYDETLDEMVDLSALLSHANTTCADIKITRPPWLVTVKWAVISLAIVQLIKEFFQLLTRRIRYLTFDNGIECFVYSSAIVVVVDLSPCSQQTGLRMNWQWSLAAVCAFLAWMNLLLLIRKLPKFGIYVVMFFDVVKTFSRFFIIFLLFIVAFSIAFYAIMQNRPEFSSMPSAVLKTAVMMIGELEFTAIFHGDEKSHFERLFGPAIAYPLFLFFCVIMTILLMNLLVGLAVDDIKSVQEKAELKRLSMQVDLVLQVEASMPYIRKLTSRSRYVTFPNEKSFWKRLRNRFGFDSSSKETLDLGTKGEEEFVSEFRQELRSQNAQLRMLQSNVDNMYERQVRTEAMIRAVLKQLKIDFEEIDAR